MINENIIKGAIKAMENGLEKEKGHFSITRDVFTTRLESFIIDTDKYLEAAIIGESGNGLKFVSEIIQDNKWDLYFQSGNGSCFINKSGIKFLVVHSY
jgi:hypothetical protein